MRDSNIGGFNKKYRIIGGIVLGVSIVALGIVFSKLGNSDIKEVDEEKFSGEITFVSNRTDKREEIQQLIEEFTEENPEVKINLELLGDAESILQRKVSVGELPDVTLVPSNISKNEYSKYFVSLDDLGFTDENIYNYDMGCGSDGLLYCLNSSINWNGIIYNKKIFEENNIENLPTTIEELFDVCQILKSNGVTPIAVNYMQSWTMNLWADIIPSLFEDNFSESVTNGGKNLLASDSGMYKALNLVREIVNNEYCEENLLNYDWQQFKNDMSEGKVAMTIWNSDFKFQLEDLGMDKDSIGIFPIPETEIIKVYGDYRFAVSKKSNNPEIAKAFLKFIFDNDRYAEAVNIMSPLKHDSEESNMFEDLKGCSIPVVIYSDYIRTKSSEYTNAESLYLELKKKNNLDGTLVQRYIMEDNLDSIIQEVNEAWKMSFLSNEKRQ